MKTLIEKKTNLARIVAYPIRDDGLLIDSARVGQITELHGDRVTVDFTDLEPMNIMTLVLGVRLSDESVSYFGAVIVRDSLDADARVIHAVRGGIAEQILAESGRIPVLNDREFRYDRSFSDEVYESWERAGILRRRVLDKVLLCPKCSALPTFRFGCQCCGSGNVKRAILVHHFACACVAPLEKFESEVSLQCPKCQTKHLMPGTDFEYSPGMHQCQSCGWKAHELNQMGHCLHCDTRFPLHQAVEQEMVGYDANRLDALAVISDFR
ncbi:MAG: hypothetical protein ABL921_35510 [Pirellula sp.]